MGSARLLEGKNPPSFRAEGSQWRHEALLVDADLLEGRVQVLGTTHGHHHDDDGEKRWETKTEAEVSDSFDVHDELQCRQSTLPSLARPVLDFCPIQDDSSRSISQNRPPTT
mmetsp:Transcript_25952/g.47241  ORF Transcript_25952/g.47241 Transcript_25952/m.47241 type:complete len:112 (+) Transcript_25952:1038-1373(+)